MALTGSELVLKTAASAAAKAALVAQPWVVNGPELQTLCDAIGTAVATSILHFTTNAVVTPTLMVAPPLGGPVTGTGVLT